MGLGLARSWWRCPRWRWLGLSRAQQPYRVVVTSLVVIFLYVQLQVVHKYVLRALHDPCDDQVDAMLTPEQQVALNHSMYTWQHEQSSDLKAFFQPRQRGYLVVGIVATGGTVNGHSKLLVTINSILKATTEADRKSLTVVAFLASRDWHINQAMFSALLHNCSTAIQNGFLHTVQLDRHRLYSSPVSSWVSTERMMAAAFYYIHRVNQGDQYIHLIEGMYAADGFIYDVKQFVSHYEMLRPRVNMVVGHLAEDPLFGSVYSVKDLGALAHYLTLFPHEQPLDQSISMFMQAKTQHKKYKYHRNLFSGTSAPVIYQSVLLCCIGLNLLL